jgi:hypothetical protein
MSETPTPEEQAELLSLGADVSGAMRSPWEPSCVAACFGTPRTKLRFTMQVWIDLDRARSPLLQGEELKGLEQFNAALDAFGFAPMAEATEEALILADGMLATIDAAFAMNVLMRNPRSDATEAAEGFGTWLPLLACLVVECSMAPAVALTLDVGQAFALLAAHRRNEGWEVKGVSYAMRDIKEPEDLTHG